jgi:diguanylate cyclase (GGDEF)-like protein/PAS domain S-box-containing protein
MQRRQPVIGDLLDVLPDTVVMVDARGRLAFVNQAARRLLGYEPGELIDRPLSILLPEALRSRHEAMVEAFRRDGQTTLMGSRPVLHALHKLGHLVPVSISLCNIVLDGEALSVAVIHDASTMNRQLDRALRLAETDDLTELGNRLHLSKRIQERLASGAPFALLFIDLTQFKQLNDRHGHETGDEVLRITAQRLRAQVREGDVAARLGGDEFVMLLDGLSRPDALAERAAGVARHLARTVQIGELSLNLTASIGGAFYPRDGQTESALLAAADRRMYEAKRRQATHCVEDSAPT